MMDMLAGLPMTDAAVPEMLASEAARQLIEMHQHDMALTLPEDTTTAEWLTELARRLRTWRSLRFPHHELLLHRLNDWLSDHGYGQGV